MCGKVISLKTGKILKPYITSGYYEVYLYEEGRKRIHSRIHKMVAKTFIPNPENKPWVNHKDGDKLNNYVDNLEWTTPKENAKHANENGLIKRNNDSRVQVDDVDLTEGITIFKNYVIFPDGKLYSVKSRIFMKQYIDIKGYFVVYINGSNKYIHRLVAEAFIPNSENKPLVNHKDGDKLNNTVDNLEWVTHKENTVHASKTGLIDYSKNFKPIIQYNINYEEIGRFSSIKEAVEKGFGDRHISSVISGKRKFSGGYVWRSADNPILKPRFPGAKQIRNSFYLFLPDKRVYSTKSEQFWPMSKENGTNKKYFRLQIDNERIVVYLDNLFQN
jgi:hypothetical protein